MGSDLICLVIEIFLGHVVNGLYEDGFSRNYDTDAFACVWASLCIFLEGDSVSIPFPNLLESGFDAIDWVEIVEHSELLEDKLSS